MGAFLWAAAFGLGGRWADQTVGVLGEYPLLRGLRLAVSPLRRLTFLQAPKKVSKKRLLLRSALAGSGSFAPGSILAQRLRFASLHLHSLCTTASYGRCAPTPGSIPPLSLPTSPVDQKQDQALELALIVEWGGFAAGSCAALLLLLWERACSRRRPDSRPDSS